MFNYSTLAFGKFVPEYYVDITDTYALKKQMFLCHDSQQGDWCRDAFGVNYVDMMESASEARGDAGGDPGVRVRGGLQAVQKLADDRRRLQAAAVTYRRLGSSDLQISPIILGAWQYGCERYWGDVPVKDACDVIARAVDRGINTVDTAIGYDGSEEIVGLAHTGRSGTGVIVISKGGADPRKMAQRVDISLSRLKLDVIDLYLVHYPDYDIPIEETIGGMVRLKEMGKIRHVGVSNFSGEQL